MDQHSSNIAVPADASSRRMACARGRARMVGKSRLSRSALHVAIIMDGNGRWAESCGLPRGEGHKAGAASVRRIVEAAPANGIRALTLFAFSSDNWGRPQSEVALLMSLLEEYLVSEGPRCRDKGVRLRVIGSLARLSASLREAIEAVEAMTTGGDVLDLRIALNYSSREAILEAARRLGGQGPISRRAFAAAVTGSPLSAPSVRGCDNVDLLIRTGGEKRLSDFLLWECAYAELYFTDVMWPDFDGDALRAALGEFRARQRRFGRLPEQERGGTFAAGTLTLAAEAARDYWLR